MWQMCCTKCNPWWKPEEETPIAIAWISFPELPPNFFEGEDESGQEEFKLINIKYDYMAKYCKTCKKQGHNEIHCWVIQLELHKRYDEVIEDQGTEKEVFGTTADSSKVLSSGKEQKFDNVKGKNKAEAVATKNKFDALKLEEFDPPALQITCGKEDGTVKEKVKKMKLNVSNKEKEKKQLDNAQKRTPIPKGTGSSIFAPRECNLNPNATGNGVDTQKERTVDWVQRRFGAPKESLNVTTNYSCQEVPSQTMGGYSKEIEITGTTNDGKELWSDEVELMKENVKDNQEDISNNQREDEQEKLAGSSHEDATVNPSLKTRVEGDHVFN
ncbi:hypothetical protein A4A49_00777 [Nicotiana attenuata]|uniref:DUF4283 domain-containing protein n=1 Tax=Nicotiana attenuata TaxID=49451 RepID=A0A1J6IIJ3_NICAT|nr:hypothetical protein A4A49_00777 [Nicotiana attenuata]